MNRYCTYLRVSTQRQGSSGLGIDAQRKMCADFIMRNNGTSEKEFVDVESGTHRDRKGLWQAIEYCQRNNVGLVIAKLDRLARDVEFTFKVMNTGIDIHFTDMPVVNSMILGVFASVAQYERELISDRTKKALAVKKSQGCKLGAASRAYREKFDNKSDEEKVCMAQKRGKTKTERYLQSRDVTAFIKALRATFTEATQGEPTEWTWNCINTKNGPRQRVLGMMKNFQDLDGTLFRGWNFTDLNSTKLQVKLANQISCLRRSVKAL